MATRHCLAEGPSPTSTAKQCITAVKAMYFLTEKENRLGWDFMKNNKWKCQSKE